MSLSAFIRDHHEEIISEFAVFAKTLMPPGAEMTDAELRDHAEDILTAVVEDMGTPQTSDEQSHKSQGRGSAKTMQALGSFTRMIASSTASRFGRCSQSFARSARPCCDSTRTAGHRTSPMCADSTKPLTRR